jgi:tetratricopeptide (TPR) repeat protein
MPDLLSAEINRIRELARKSQKPENIPTDQVREILTLFRDHECWDPYFRLMQYLIDLPAFRTMDLFIELARTQNLYLEDVFGAAETCAKAVKNLKLGFLQISEEIIPKVLDSGDFAAEATILSAVGPLFADHSDHVKSLERLCLIYEKKTHNDRLLASAYDQLIAIDSGNIKALRYFKLVHSQNNEWEEVAQTLRNLISNVTYPQELYRVAQELAAVLLYQLDQPQEAIQVIETFCSDSPLDTSMILYEAYEQLANHGGCLRILREALLTVNSEDSRAILLYKIGVMEERLGKKKLALEHYRLAFEQLPLLLDAAEGIVTLAIEQKNWALVQSTLNTLEQNAREERLKGQILHAIRRLKDGVEHATRN